MHTMSSYSVLSKSLCVCIQSGKSAADIAQDKGDADMLQLLLASNRQQPNALSISSLQASAPPSQSPHMHRSRASAANNPDNSPDSVPYPYPAVFGQHAMQTARVQGSASGASAARAALRGTEQPTTPATAMPATVAASRPTAAAAVAQQDEPMQSSIPHQHQQRSRPYGLLDDNDSEDDAAPQQDQTLYVTGSVLEGHSQVPSACFAGSHYPVCHWHQPPPSCPALLLLWSNGS